MHQENFEKYDYTYTYVCNSEHNILVYSIPRFTDCKAVRVRQVAGERTSPSFVNSHAFYRNLRRELTGRHR